MTTDDSIIIFHRSKQNSEENLANQKAFLEAHKEHLNSVKVIDYMSGEYHQAREVFEVFKSTNFSKKVIVIMHSFLSKKDYESEYNMYFYLQYFRNIGNVSMYLMDSDGRLYKEMDTIEML